MLTIPEHLSTPAVFSWVRVAKLFAFGIVFCRLLFVVFILAHLRFTASD